MECRSCIEALTALMDDELSPEERNFVQEHLSSCPSCEKERSSLAYAYGLVDHLPSLNPTPQLWHKIRAELATEEMEGESFWDLIRNFLFRPWVPATAGAAVLIISLLMINPASDPLERDFANFIQQREEQFQENATILFSNERDNRYHPRRNPFSRAVTQVQHNPFQE